MRFGMLFGQDLTAINSLKSIYSARQDAENVSLGGVRSWGGYVYQAQNGGLGSDISQDVGFDTPAAWVFTGDSAGLSVASSLLQNDGSNIATGIVSEASPQSFDNSSTYRFTYSGKTVTSGPGFQIRFTGGGTATGYIQDVFPDGSGYVEANTGTGSALKFDFQALTVGQLDYCAIQKVLKTGTGDPVFPGIGSTVVDGDITWKCLRAE